MKMWLYQQRMAATQALKRLAQQPFGVLLGALVIGIAAALPMTGWVLTDNVAGLARSVSGTPELSLFMRLGTPTEDVRQLEERLRRETGVAAVRFISRDDALRQLSSTSGVADVVATLPDNPLPDALIVSLRDAQPSRFEALAKQLAALPQVEHVQMDSAWVQRLYALIELGRTGVLLVASLLGTALVIVTFNTIRLQLLTQRHEIGVSRLLGATHAFIRRPFHWFGFLQGALGGLAALGIVTLATLQLQAPVAELATGYGIRLTLSGPGLLDAVLLIAITGGLGWLGAAISVWHHLRQLEH